jgi:hypothetical protein
VTAPVKLKWRVQPAPTGRYRSFEHRGWPSAEYPSEKTAARITCLDEYYPANVRSGSHAQLTVWIADWSAGADGSGFAWRTLKEKAKTLDEAKDLVRRAIEANPQVQPKEETNG